MPRLSFDKTRAHDHQPEALLNPSPPGADQDGAWLVRELVVQKLLLCREGRRETTWRDLRTRMARTLEVLQATPRPRDGRSLMGAYAAQHFEREPS